MENVNWSLGIVMVIYIVGLMMVGYLGIHKTKNIGDYLIAGRNVGPWLVATSYGSTFVSGVAIIGFGGLGYHFGFNMSIIGACMILGAGLFSWIVLADKTRDMSIRLGAMTIPEFMGSRYNSIFAQGFSSLVVCIFLIPYASAIYVAGGNLLASSVGIPYWLAVILIGITTTLYLVKGGIFSVLYTDFVNSFLMVIGLLAIFIGTYSLLGGFTMAHQKLMEVSPQSVSFLPVDHPAFLSIVVGLSFVAAFSPWVSPQLTSRFIFAKDKQTLRLSVPIVLALLIVGSSIGTIPVILSKVLFAQQGITFTMAETDRIYPTFVNMFFSPVIVYLFVISVIAAIVSTANSVIHVCGGTIGRDLYHRIINPQADQDRVLSITRSIMGVVCVVSIIVALRPPTIIAMLFAFSTAILAGCYFGPYVLGLYWRGVTKRGVEIAMVVGFSVALFWEIVKPNNIPPVIVAIFVSLLVTIIASILSDKLPQSHLDSLFGKASDKVEKI